MVCLPAVQHSLIETPIIQGQLALGQDPFGAMRVRLPLGVLAGSHPADLWGAW